MTTENEHAFRGDDVEEVFADYIERLNRGERISACQIEQEHPEHAADLIEQLSVFQDGVLEREDSAPLRTLGRRRRDYDLSAAGGRL